MTKPSRSPTRARAPAPVHVGTRFRDPVHSQVGCVLRVNRRTKRVVVVWEQPQGEPPLDVLPLARVLQGRRLPGDLGLQSRMPCPCCGTTRRFRVTGAAKLARKLGYEP